MRGRDRLVILAVCCQFAILLSASLRVRTAMAQNIKAPAKHSEGALLTIVNPKRRNIPEEKIRVLFAMTCEVVAQEFHRDASETQFRLTLILGERDEHYMMAPDGDLTLYLDEWNKDKFVDGAITGALQHLTSLRIRKRVSAEILRRSDKILPVPAKDLRALPNRPLSTRTVRDCTSAISDEPCPWTRQPR